MNKKNQILPRGVQRWTVASPLSRVKCGRQILRLLALSVVLCTSTGLARAASLRWARQEIVAPAKVGQKTITAAFSFKNIGSTPVAITSVETTCDCTQARATRRVVPPGED